MKTKLNEDLFRELTDKLDILIQEVRKKSPDVMVTDRWTVKDVLAHVAFWHNNYADNYKALSEGKEQPLLIGPYYRINQEGVDLYRKYSSKELEKRLKKAHRSLRKSIIEDGVSEMQYKHQGRVMKSPEFIEAVSAHLRGHIKQIKKLRLSGILT